MAEKTALQTAKTHIGRAVASKFPAAFCVVFAFVIMTGHLMGAFRWLDLKDSDILFRQRGMQRVDDRITMVVIDDDSIKEVGQFPWPRSIYKTLIENLMKGGVKVVALDVMFIDPSRPAEDQALIAVTRRYADRIIHAVTVDPQVANEHVPVYPFPALRAVTKHFGQVTQPLKNDDGSIRMQGVMIGRAPRVRLEEWANDASALPSLGAAAVSVLEGKPPREYLKLPGLDEGVAIRLNIPGDGEKSLGVQTMPDGSLEEIKVRDFGVPRIPAWRVLKNDLLEAQKERLKGGVVFIGSTALGAFDHFPSPFSSQEPGVMVHVSMADNILQNRYITGGNPLTPILLVPPFILLAYLIVGMTPLASGLSFIAALSAILGVHYFLFLHLYYFEIAGPLVGFISAFLVLIVHKTIEENRKAAEVRSMFGQYVAPEVVDILVKNPEKLSLGGEKRDMTMFFLDIAHFTTISEKMSPENLIQFLNTYLTALTDDILSNNGVVDKYIGDCIMAFWNAPLEEKEHRRKACLAAVACVKTIARLNREYVDPTIPETPAVRIGLNSGEVVVGNTGSARKLAYTVLGDEVNLASRLEGANKFFGSTLMASEDTYNGARDVVEARLLGSVRVVGKNIPIKVFELLAKKGDLDAGWQKALKPYHEAIALYEQRKFEEAKVLFEKVLESVPGDKTTKLYLSVCQDYSVLPPPEGWEPVFNLTSK